MRAVVAAGMLTILGLVVGFGEALAGAPTHVGTVTHPDGSTSSYEATDQDGDGLPDVVRVVSSGPPAVDETKPLTPGSHVEVGGLNFVVGTSGDDQMIEMGFEPWVMFGGPGNDTLGGGGGEDHLFGGAGDDTICGGGGSDRIEGGEDDDTLDGEGGADLVLGGGGDDVVRGGEGDDAVFGNGGDDTLDPGTGSDICDGGPGDDTVLGGPGTDE